MVGAAERVLVLQQTLVFRQVRGLYPGSDCFVFIAFIIIEHEHKDRSFLRKQTVNIFKLYYINTL